MDGFQQAYVIMAVIDSQWSPCDAHGRRRQLNAEELDALADFGWQAPDLKGVVAACAQAVRSRWRPALRRPVRDGGGEA
jgi:hypothetical protein